MPNGEYGLGIDIGGATIETVVSVLERDAAGSVTGVSLDSPHATLPTTFTIGTAGWPRLRGHGAGTGDEDARAAARLLDRVGSSTPLLLSGRRVPAAGTIAALLAQTTAMTTEQRGRPPAWTTVTVPPSWGEHRRTALVEALVAEGLAPVSVVSGAVACVRALDATGRLPEGSPVLVLDLGASALDAAVVRIDGAGRPAHVAVPPARLRWGGWDVDDVVVAHVRSCLDEPSGASDPRAGSAALLAACVAAKESLSSSTAVEVELGGAFTPASVRLTREELEELLAGAVDAVVGAAADAVTAAGSTPAALGAVVLAGGGAHMPLVAERLSVELGVPLVVEDEPARTPARGAALEAADRLLRAVEAQGETPEAEPAAEPAANAGEQPPVSRRPPADRGRGHRDRRPSTHPSTSPRSGRPPAGPTSGARATLRRGALVAGLFVALLLTPPVLLDLLGAATTGAPPGTPAAAARTAGPADPSAHPVDAGAVSVAAATADQAAGSTGGGTRTQGSATAAGGAHRAGTGGGASAAGGTASGALTATGTSTAPGSTPPAALAGTQDATTPAPSTAPVTPTTAPSSPPAAVPPDPTTAPPTTPPATTTTTNPPAPATGTAQAGAPVPPASQTTTTQTTSTQTTPAQTTPAASGTAASGVTP